MENVEIKKRPLCNSVPWNMLTLVDVMVKSRLVTFTVLAVEETDTEESMARKQSNKKSDRKQMFFQQGTRFMSQQQLSTGNYGRNSNVSCLPVVLNGQPGFSTARTSIAGYQYLSSDVRVRLRRLFCIVIVIINNNQQRRHFATENVDMNS